MILVVGRPRATAMPDDVVARGADVRPRPGRRRLGVPLEAVVIGARRDGRPVGRLRRRDGRTRSGTSASRSSRRPRGRQGVVDAMARPRRQRRSWRPGAIAATRSWRTSPPRPSCRSRRTCTEVEPGDTFTSTRLRWGGSLLEEARLSGTVKLLTVAPHALAPRRHRCAIAPVVEPLIPALSGRRPAGPRHRAGGDRGRADLARRTRASWSAAVAGSAAPRVSAASTSSPRSSAARSASRAP